jgi:hypothetical protein
VKDTVLAAVAQHARHMALIANVLKWPLADIRMLSVAEMQGMNDALVDMIEGNSLRSEGQELDPEALTDEELMALAEKAVEDPSSLTLNAIRLLGRIALGN